MNCMLRVLRAIAVLTAVSACDRKPDDRAQSEPPASRTPAMPGAGGPDKAAPGNVGDTRRGALTGAGADICGDWNLEGGRLAECRRQWMDAPTDADRLRIRNLYAPTAGNKEANEIAIDPDPQPVGSASFCDQLRLRGPDLSECRAQWQAAKTEGDLARVRTRYEAIGANPDAAGSRSLGAPSEAPAANRAHP